MISVIILTHNEETNIARCLDSVSWTDDVLVVDSFSEDRTVEISKRHGARVIQRAFEDFSSQRNFASEQGHLKHEWVLHLDADEVVTPELRAELARVMFGDKDAYRVSSKLIFCGKFLRHAGLFPWYQVRFGRKQALRFKQVEIVTKQKLSCVSVEQDLVPLFRADFDIDVPGQTTLAVDAHDVLF